MTTYQGLTFSTIREQDIPALTAIMKRAFDEDTRLHLGREAGGPPGYDDGSFLRRYALDDAATAYQILQNSIVIGGIILWIHADTKENFLGSLFVDAALENKGVGKVVWDFVEQAYPDTKIWRTETPIFSHRNHHFYVNKCGFHVVRIENPRDIENGSFLLEKRM